MFSAGKLDSTSHPQPKSHPVYRMFSFYGPMQSGAGVRPFYAVIGMLCDCAVILVASGGRRSCDGHAAPCIYRQGRSGISEHHKNELL